jgi:hypothetical protein
VISQGVLQGQITKLANQPEKLKALMADKTDEQKRLGRIHLQMVRLMGAKK